MLRRNAAWPGPNHGQAVPRDRAGPAATGLVGEIAAFQRRHQMSDSAFAKFVRLSSYFVGNLRGGAEPKPATIARIRAAIAEHDREAGL